jgi:hypothetical protein
MEDKLVHEFIEFLLHFSLSKGQFQGRKTTTKGTLGAKKDVGIDFFHFLWLDIANRFKRIAGITAIFRGNPSWKIRNDC